MSMTSGDPLQTNPSLRLRTPGPHPDESVSSALDRAASLWGISRWDVLRHIGYTKRHETEFDGVLPEPLRLSMARAFNMDPSELASRSVPVSRLVALLAPRLRHAYCPLCFEGDWSVGITPYFRLDWARLWATHCRVHAAPLFEWMALNGYGDRRLPHAYYLPQSESAQLPTWMTINLQEARKWQASNLPADETYELWRALMKVEATWWMQDIGDLGSPPMNVRGEHVLVRLAALFLAARDAGQPCLAETLQIAPHQHRVLGYDRRRQGREGHDGNFRRLRWQLPSIQARRTVLILVAHTLGMLGVDLRYATGARLPAGRSRDWASHILNHQRDFKLARRSLESLEVW